MVLGLGLCTEFNVEQLMQLLRCVAAVLLLLLQLLLLLLLLLPLRHGMLIRTERERGRGVAGFGQEIVAVLENFV